MSDGPEVERVARAIDPVGWQWYDEAPADHPAKPVFRKDQLKRARAAIAERDAALEDADLVLVPREPTPAMVQAAETKLGLWEGFLAEDAWRIMCDAARKGGDESP